MGRAGAIGCVMQDIGRPLLLRMIIVAAPVWLRNYRDLNYEAVGSG